MRKMLLSACAVFLFGATSIANADLTFNLAAVPGIDGDQANMGAGTGSSATGSATMTYNQSTSLLSWNISWSGLKGTISAAHFHGPAPASVNAGVQVKIGGPDLTSPSIGEAVITTDQAEDLLAGLWYINIHTDLHPSGEIRGQVDLAPPRCKVGADTDNDGILDENDNCCIAQNGPLNGPNNQTDTDNDGYGNVCDMDLNQNGFVNFADLAIFKCSFFRFAPDPPYNSEADCNVDDVVNFVDLFGVDPGGVGFLPHSCMVQNLFLTVGPSCVDLPPDQIGPECLTDEDGDGIPSTDDNCTNVANPDQLDTDADGFGNICDPDLNGDCAVDDEDTAIMNLAFFSTPGDPDWNPDADLDGDLVVGFFDLEILETFVPRGKPGPSALIGCLPHEPDSDCDGITNSEDNCTIVANPDQLDTNGDGFGNVCDPDLNNDCIVDDDDTAILMGWFFSPPGVNPDGDLDGDLEIGFTDLQVLESYLGQSPGPSGLADCTEER